MDDTEKMLGALLEQGAAWIVEGKSSFEVREAYLQLGLSDEVAGALTDQLFAMRAKVQSDAATRNMWVGGAWCVGGIVVTALTYGAASGGGTYVVAWGAIIFGAVQLFRGMAAASDVPAPPSSR